MKQGKENMMLASEIIRGNMTDLKKQFSETIKNRKFDYKNLGSSIEEYCEPILTNLLKNNGITDITFAPSKNDFPDLQVNTIPLEAIDFKAGNHSRKTKGTWTSTNNSNNDLGTLRSLPSKINKYGGENIYFFFIEYNINDDKQELVDLKFDNFYKFIGVGSDGELKYRKKDGNLRPKDFNKPSNFNDFNSFAKLINKTIVKRSISISEEHLTVLKDILKKDYDL